MDYISAEKERIIRFYHWALTDFEREIAEDYRLIRTVPKWAGADFLKAIEPLTKDELISLSRGLVKARHHAALALTGIEIGPDERQQVARFRLEVSKLRKEAQLCLFGIYREAPVRFRSKEVIDELLAHPMLAVFSDQKRSGPYFMAKVNSWNIKTQFSYNPMIRRVEYWHSTYRRDGKQLSVPEFGNGLDTHMTTDLLSWLGIDRTMWAIESKEDMAQAAVSLSQIMQHYTTFITPIIADLI